MNVMKRAWEIAKEAVVQFGGKVKEYFAEALKQAWVELRMKLNQFAPFAITNVSKGPTLPMNVEGTEKQVKWANSIRTKMNADIFNFLATGNAQGRVSVKFFAEFIETARALFTNNTSASFWIDNRDAKIGQLVAAYRKELMA